MRVGTFWGRRLCAFFPIQNVGAVMISEIKYLLEFSFSPPREGLHLFTDKNVICGAGQALGAPSTEYLLK